jgi:chemotaxis signal transduction protein
MRPEQASHTVQLVPVGGAQWIALAAGLAHEIIEPPAVHRVPGGPAWAAGLVAWRGNHIPVVDVLARMEARAAGEARRCLVVACGGAAAFGAIVLHGLPRITQVAPQDEGAAAAGSPWEPWALAFLATPDGPVPVLHPADLFGPARRGIAAGPAA